MLNSINNLVVKPIGEQSDAAWYIPNWREEQARDYDLKAADIYVKRYRGLLQDGEKCGDDAVVAAHLVHCKPWLRGQIEAYLMAGSTAEEICERFRLFPETIEIYAKVFCDIEPLKDHEGSLMEACLDRNNGKDLNRLRMFGLRYGKIFLDWILSKIKVLTPADFELVELRLRSILLMRAVQAESISLSDKDRYNTILKVISTLAQYKSTISTGGSRTELEDVLCNLKGLVERAAPPIGLPNATFEIAVTNPLGNGS